MNSTYNNFPIRKLTPVIMNFTLIFFRNITYTFTKYSSKMVKISFQLGCVHDEDLEK